MPIMLLPIYTHSLNPGIYSECVLLALGGWVVHLDLREWKLRWKSSFTHLKSASDDFHLERSQEIFVICNWSLKRVLSYARYRTEQRWNVSFRVSSLRWKKKQLKGCVIYSSEGRRHITLSLQQEPFFWWHRPSCATWNSVITLQHCHHR